MKELKKKKARKNQTKKITKENDKKITKKKTHTENKKAGHVFYVLLKQFCCCRCFFLHDRERIDRERVGTVKHDCAMSKVAVFPLCHMQGKKNPTTLEKTKSTKKILETEIYDIIKKNWAQAGVSIYFVENVRKRLRQG